MAAIETRKDIFLFFSFIPTTLCITRASAPEVSMPGVSVLKVSVYNVTQYTVVGVMYKGNLLYSLYEIWIVR